MDHSRRTILNGFPQAGRVLFGEAHDAFCIAHPKRVSLLDTIDECVMHNKALRIESDEVLVRPVREVQGQPPGEGLFAS